MEQPRNLLDTVELAEHLDVKPETLEKWRQQGRGPEYIKVGRLIRYRMPAVDQWLDSRTQRA